MDEPFCQGRARELKKGTHPWTYLPSQLIAYNYTDDWHRMQISWNPNA